MASSEPMKQASLDPNLSVRKTRRQVAPPNRGAPRSTVIFRKIWDEISTSRDSVLNFTWISPMLAAQSAQNWGIEQDSVSRVMKGLFHFSDFQKNND